MYFIFSSQEALGQEKGEGKNLDRETNYFRVRVSNLIRVKIKKINNKSLPSTPFLTKHIKLTMKNKTAGTLSLQLLRR